MGPTTSTETHHFARAQRAAMTEAEIALWSYLRRKQVDGIRFRRQVPIGSYVVDFASFHPKIAIELDGSQHADAQVYDAKRTTFLEGQGYCVLRFWNHEMFQDRQTVLATIWRTASDLRSRAGKR